MLPLHHLCVGRVELFNGVSAGGNKVRPARVGRGRQISRVSYFTRVSLKKGLIKNC